MPAYSARPAHSARPARARAVAALLTVAAAMMAGCEKAPPAAPLPSEGVIRLSDQFSPDFTLVDADGRVMSNADLKGKAAIVYFGFASCPDVCPLALGRVSAALNELSEKEREKVAALFITVDPDRDTPEALKRYLAFDPRIVGLTGDRAAIERAKAGFKVYAEAEPVTDAKLGYTVQHSSLFYLIEKDGSLRYALQDTLTPAELATAIRTALGGRK